MGLERAGTGVGDDAGSPRGGDPAGEPRGRGGTRPAAQLHVLRRRRRSRAARRGGTDLRGQGARTASGHGETGRGKVVAAPVVRHGRRQAERRGQRLLRVPAALAEGRRGGGGRRRQLRGGARGEAVVRQGPAAGRGAGRLHARQGHAGPEPQPELLPDDGHPDDAERGAGARQWRAGGQLRAAGRPGGSPGLLSWHAQKRAEKPTLDEAGSYGYLVSATLPAAAIEAAAASGEIVLRLEVDDALPGGSRCTVRTPDATRSTRPWC